MEQDFVRGRLNQDFPDFEGFKRIFLCCVGIFSYPSSIPPILIHALAHFRAFAMSLCVTPAFSRSSQS